MALIGKIRKSMWIVVVLIALGVGGFILQDMTSGQQSMFGGGQTTLGKVNGEKIDWREFIQVEDLLYRNSAADVYGRRNALWNYYVEDIIIQKEASLLGLGVSKAELIDLQFGVSPSPIIRQRFQDPNTGAVDRQRLSEFQNAIETNTLTDPTMRAFWAHQEKEIIKDRLQTKLGGLVSKAIYTPTWMAEMGYLEQTERVDFAYVRASFDDIDNEEVALEDKDFELYLKENAKRYEQKEETRKIEYVVFDVFPTAKDSADIREGIANLIPEFEETEDDSLFVERNFGMIDAAYFKKADISEVIADTVFRMPIGAVYGPYIDAGAYQAVKVLDRKVIPDSVRSRHILIPANDQLTLFNAINTVDSLKGLIEAGTHTFDSLARAFGTDATRDKGGDLDYAFQGQMVKPFNDLIFYEAEQGKLYSVITQFGVHLVEVTGRKFINNEQGVKLAYLVQNIVPSEETQNNVYEQAQQLASRHRTLDDLRKAIKGNKDLNVEVSPLLKKNDFAIGTLGTGATARDMIRWAFGAKKGTVSPDVYAFQSTFDVFNDKYVVIGLRTIQKQGLPAIENIREEIEPQVINRKKGEILAARMKGKSLEALAAEFSTRVDTALNISFAVPSIPEVGPEPKVIANAFALSNGKTSTPIVGNSGVYMLTVINIVKAVPPSDLSGVRTSMSAAIRSQAQVGIMQTLRDKADIKDNRFTFF